jgi:hypothetical protein
MSKASKITKSTTLEGYYASGDYECFCFDRHDGPEEHRKAYGAKWNRGVADDECRVYPGDFLPENTDGKRGRWTITVEFEPYEDPSN